MAQKKSIAFVTPLEYDVTVDGYQVLVRPLNVQQIGEAAEHVDALLAEFAAAPPEVQLALVAGGELAPQTQLTVTAWALNLLARRHAMLIELVDLALDQVELVVSELLPDRLVALFLLIIEVNADFFSRAKPMLVGLATAPGLPWNHAASAASPSTGPTPLSSSSPTATDTPTF